MAVALEDLADAVRAEMNPLGGTPVLDDTPETTEAIVRSLVSSFWTAKTVGGWFAQYRVNVDGDQIVNVSDGGEDLDRAEQQIVVLFAVLGAWEARLLQMPTGRRAKQGTNEVERTYSATVIRGILDAKRAQLDGLVEEMRRDGRDTAVGVLDLAFIGAACGRTYVR